MDTKMQEKVQMLIDHFDIREVIEAYVDGCDRCDKAAVRDVYHPDSWDNHGPLDMCGPDFADACVQSLIDNWSTCNHLLGQSRIRVSGDEAGVQTYFHASLTREADGVTMLDQMVGRYIDKFERRDGQWRIKDRRCIAEWSYSAPTGEDFMRGDLFLHGARDPSDIANEVLGLKPGNMRIQR